MRVGLTLGKFAPLHRGHELVIETGVRETDRMVVLIYGAEEVTRVPLVTRAGWIRELYPEVEVIEASDGPSAMGNEERIRRLQEEYILRKLAGRRITHFYSSEFYGDHVSRALDAFDRRVDPERAIIPISGTSLRSDPYAGRPFVDPVVYRDLVTWVVFVGAPSTGKTTLCEALAEKYETAWMPEYGREYWQKRQKDRRLAPEELLEIAVGHREREEERVLEANRILFVDTDASTTAQFARYYHGTTSAELAQLAEEASERYDLCFLCEDDIPYDETWDRSGELVRATFQRQIRQDLIRRGVEFVSLHGSLEQRMGKVEETLETRGLHTGKL